MWLQSNVLLDLDLCVRRSCTNTPDRLHNATAISYAILNGDAAMVQVLIDAGADLFQRGLNGQPPLHLAVWRGQKQLIKMLAMAGADAALTNSKGQTAVEAATRSVWPTAKSAAQYLEVFLGGHPMQRSEL